MKTHIAIILIVAALLLGAGGVGVGFYLYNQDVVKRYNEEITRLNLALQEYGDKVVVYRVKTTINKGATITDDLIETMELPSQFINESYVGNKEDIVGKYAKITLMRGTPITADTLMEDDVKDEKGLYNTIREYDVVVNMWPIGLQIGDYVDMRIQMPYGEEYIVLSHMRINGMSDNTVKFLMTELQINLYQSALVDYYINSSEGVILYFTKYIEPGVQEPAVITYKVSDQILTAIKNNPNLYSTAYATVYNAEARSNIEKDLVPYEESNTTERTSEQATQQEEAAISGLCQ